MHRRRVPALHALTGVAVLALGVLGAASEAEEARGSGAGAASPPGARSPAAREAGQAEVEGALALAAEGRCPAALPRLEALADGAAEGDARVHRALGLCRLHLGRPAEAVRALERALALDPTDAEAALQLGAARYHLGDREGARAALERVGAPGRERAEWWLYRGLLALDAGESASALGALERARGLEPAAVEPVASFYAGSAAARAGRSEAAREAFARVLRDWPGTAFADEARRALTSLDPPPRRFVWLRAGAEYDDNVVLRGDGVALPAEIGDEADVRGVWDLEAGGDLWREPDAALGLAARYAGSAHADLDAFDVHYPGLRLWLDRGLTPETLLRAELGAGYAWVDAEPFLADQRARLALWRRGGALAGAHVFAEAYREDVFFEVDDVPDGPGMAGAPCVPAGALVCGPAGLDESEARDRDGFGFRVGIGRELPLPGVPGGGLYATYRFHAFRAEGREYTFDAHELLLGAQVPLPAAWTLELDLFLAYRPYRHPTTFPDPDALVAGRAYGLEGGDRRERELRTRLAVERPLGEVLRVGADWRYTHNDSTAEVFDYDRHVVGAYVTVGFGG